jgi:hypothetical protein
MKDLNDRRRLQLLLSSCLVSALMSIGTMAGATTIDFENLSLGGEDMALMSPLEIQGVRIFGFQNGFLVRESANYPCDDVSEVNQAYMGFTVQFGCIEGCCPSQFISIEFPGPPAEPVTQLSLEARSSSGPLFLRTYDAIGNRTETSINPPPAACSLSRRGTLEISTALPIAVAEIWSGNRLPDGCCDGCISFGSTIVIDNVTFPGGPLSTAHTSWGRIKALYR